MNTVNPNQEIEDLRAQVATLEQLLEVYEQETVEKSSRLEQALAKLQAYSAQLVHSEAALQVLQSILDSMGECVVVADQNGKFLLFNPPAEQLLHLDVNLTLTEWMQSQHYPVCLADQVTPYPTSDFPLVRAIQGEATDGAEVFVRSKAEVGGTWQSVTARSLTDRQGNLQGGVVVFHNITQRKQSEAALHESEGRSRQQAEQLKQTLDELRQTQAQLVQTEKMSSLGQLVAGIAHEINNPVNFIYGNLAPASQYVKDLLHLVQLYQQHYPDPTPEIQSTIEEIDLAFLQGDLEKLLRSLHLGTDRIRQIVLSLRNFSRLDEAAMKPVDIHEGIDNTLLILQNRLKPKLNFAGIQVVKAYGNLPLIECYAGQLNQVFLNILANAINALEAAFGCPTEAIAEPLAASQNHELAQCEKAYHASQPLSYAATAVNNALHSTPDLDAAQSLSLPTITISTEISGDRVIIRMADNGTGIPAPIQARLFDPFFTTKPVGQGTGLGLYISYQIIVDKHRGELACHSQPGEGTEFWIQIPVSQAKKQVGESSDSHLIPR